MTAPDRELLERILESDDLSGAAETTGAVQALLDALSTLLGDLLGADAAEGFADVAPVIVFGAAGLLGLWVLARALGRLAPRRTAPRAPARAPVRLSAPEVHRADARAARERGDLRAALRHRFLAALAHLERARWVGYGRHRTNREYVADLETRGAPAAAKEAFATVVELFDARWYGLVPVSDDDLDALEAGCRALESAEASP